MLSKYLPQAAFIEVWGKCVRLFKAQFCVDLQFALSCCLPSMSTTVKNRHAFRVLQFLLIIIITVDYNFSGKRLPLSIMRLFHREKVYPTISTVQLRFLNSLVTVIVMF